jgi:hypothetical protein
LFVRPALRGRSTLKHKPRPAQGKGRGLLFPQNAGYFFAYSSTGLSFGFAQACLVLSLAA